MNKANSIPAPPHSTSLDSRPLASETPPPRPEERSQCVLFVDDEPAVLDSLRLILRQTPYTKLFIQSPLEALELIETRPVDIVVADEQMPDMSGSEFLASVHKRKPGTVRIVLSGHASREQVITAVNSGQIQRFLTKPLKSAMLTDILDEYLSAIRLNATQEALLNRGNILGRWEWDVIRGTLGWNKGFEQLLHFSPAPGGTDLAGLFGSTPAEDRHSLLETINDCKDKDQAREAEHRVILPDGSQRWIMHYIDVFRDEKKTWRVIGTIRDITDSKEREALQAERLVILENILGKAVDALARMTEMRDPYTAGHQARVSGLTVKVGMILGLDASRLQCLQTAATLHDIGKISIPSEILTKPGKLNNEEMNLIKCHSEIGFEILRDIPFPLPVSTIVRQHHERMDGSGYPKGLLEKDILLESRILAVTDTFEAMSSFRPYRPALGTEAALQELERNKGVKLDPAVVDALVHYVTRDKDGLQEIMSR